MSADTCVECHAEPRTSAILGDRCQRDVVRRTAEMVKDAARHSMTLAPSLPKHRRWPPLSLTVSGPVSGLAVATGPEQTSLPLGVQAQPGLTSKRRGKAVQ